MLDVLIVNKKESEANAILRKLGTSAKSFFSKVVENNLNWRGNWPRDHKFGVLVCVGAEGKHSKFFRDISEQDEYVYGLYGKYKYGPDEVFVEVWTYDDKPKHDYDICIN